MKAIGELLEQRRSADEEVAFEWADGCEVHRWWSDFVGDVVALNGRIARAHPGPWVLITEDAYAFAVGLFALWHAGQRAIIPPNHQPATLSSLETRRVGVLTDRPDWSEPGTSLHPLAIEEPGDRSTLQPIRRDAEAIELFTSGTTGASKSVIKRIAHLDDEVAQLESCWARELENTSIYSTASHLHLYGLLFGVLWPLCSGRPFAADRPLYPGQLLSRMKARERCVLVSVPVSLRPLARHGGAADLAGRCETMFSSGGPLPPETAHELAAVVGRAPIEVFGSTETGGIAHRRLSDDAEDEWWRPFPNVRIEALPDEEDDRYEVTRVHSPLVSGGDGSSSHCTGDRIELRADGRFRLGGRSNLVAKIGEKRLDMAQMASQLMGHPFVDEVALTTVQRDADTRVAAVVIASDRGHEVLEIRGRRAFARALCDDLMANWDPILHPRLWRVVDALPVDARGKVSQELLRPLFEAVQAEPRQSDRPRIIEEQRGEGSAEWLCEVPADLECFAGHFPGIPVVPGVVQLDWVMALLAGLRGAAPRLRRIELVKFMTPLVPGDRFRLGVRVREAGPTGAGGTVVVFDLADGERAISRGRLVIAEDPVSEVDGEAS